MNGWARTLLFLGIFWLLSRWVVIGSFPATEPRMIALYAAVLLAVFIVWRDGRPLLARLGLLRADAPLTIIERRLARGELDLQTYRALRAELCHTQSRNQDRKHE